MADEDLKRAEESHLLSNEGSSRRNSEDVSASPVSSASTTSLVLEGLNNGAEKPHTTSRYHDEDGDDAHKPEAFDVEDGHFRAARPVDKKARRLLWVLGTICVIGWSMALVMFLFGGYFRHPPSDSEDSVAPGPVRNPGKRITLDSVQKGEWRPQKQSISWIGGANGEDGYLLEHSLPDKDYLVVEDVRHRNDKQPSENSITLMKSGGFMVGSDWVFPNYVWPSPDLKKVLVMSDVEKLWRHSRKGKFSIFDVEKQEGEALDPGNAYDVMQLASWSPQSDAVVFTRDNNMFLRKINSSEVIQITEDGGPELFYGIPDWVYEEEVFAGNSATWWSEDGEYVAFLRTDESAVPTFPVQYFITHPSSQQKKPGEENYPYVKDIKYPKAGAPNPVVNLQLYDVGKNEVFSVKIEDDFDDKNRLITEVVWAGKSKKVLVKETNRESDILKVVLIDVESRTGKTVRTEDVNKIDGGWFEVSERTTFVPADAAKGRNEDGYVDTIIHEGFDHLGYFTPLDSPKPTILTSGEWEVVNAPSAIDLNNNEVYFVATKESSTQRHVYKVNFDGSQLTAVTNVEKEGYYDVSFSTKAGYALLSYEGPRIPWQKIVSTPSNDNHYEELLEENKQLADEVRKHDMPTLTYETVSIDGFDINVVERRPAHFDENRKYPVLFQLYGGPGSQEVSKRFRVDFQSYVASSLDYVVVTVDGRGTGFLGRKFRCVTRGNLGYWEAHDQIAVAKMWAQKRYVDEERLAIWGWSFGGFMALKTLETDGGETFKYGMAVAPVTDWHLYGMSTADRGQGILVLSKANIIRFDLHRALHAHAPEQSLRLRQRNNHEHGVAVQEHPLLGDARGCRRQRAHAKFLVLARQARLGQRRELRCARFP